MDRDFHRRLLCISAHSGGFFAGTLLGYVLLCLNTPALAVMSPHVHLDAGTIHTHYFAHGDRDRAYVESERGPLFHVEARNTPRHEPQRVQYHQASETVGSSEIDDLPLCVRT